ncbi:MAG: hypothetical protein IKE23_01345 [Exiguobacterium sp.]|nr:hypothetical protein [Exiguobacterium sp.]
MKDVVYAALYAVYTVVMAILLVFLGERWQNRLYLDAGWTNYDANGNDAEEEQE